MRFIRFTNDVPLTAKRKRDEDEEEDENKVKSMKVSLEEE